MHIVRESRVRDGKLAVANGAVRRKHDVAAIRQSERRRQLADANPRPLQIAENGNRTSEGVGRLTDQRNIRRMLLVRAMREVDASYIEPGLEEAAQRVGRTAGRPERADDLRAAE